MMCENVGRKMESAYGGGGKPLANTSTQRGGTMPSCKVVITGLGILSPIGIGAGAVLDSLRKGKSGITACQEYIEKGMRSQVAGLVPKIDFKEFIDRKMLRFM